tara:strand:+ start:191 stop:445 length:255 start_codon:yes stop_codon:yes gene_type:complete
MALETRKEKMDHMFALIEESRVLVGRRGDHSDIEPTIRQLNYRIDEIRKELSLNKYELDKEQGIDSMFNMNRGNPYNEGSGGDD